MRGGLASPVSCDRTTPAMRSIGSSSQLLFAQFRYTHRHRWSVSVCFFAGCGQKRNLCQLHRRHHVHRLDPTKTIAETRVFTFRWLSRVQQPKTTSTIANEVNAQQQRLSSTSATKAKITAYSLELNNQPPYVHGTATNNTYCTTKREPPTTGSYFCDRQCLHSLHIGN